LQRTETRLRRLPVLAKLRTQQLDRGFHRGIGATLAGVADGKQVRPTAFAEKYQVLGTVADLDLRYVGQRRFRINAQAAQVERWGQADIGIVDARAILLQTEGDEAGARLPARAICRERLGAEQFEVGQRIVIGQMDANPLHGNRSGQHVQMAGCTGLNSRQRCRPSWRQPTQLGRLPAARFAAHDGGHPAQGFACIQADQAQVAVLHSRQIDVAAFNRDAIALQAHDHGILAQAAPGLQVIAAFHAEACDHAIVGFVPVQGDGIDALVECAGIQKPVARGRGLRAFAIIAGLDAANATAAIAFNDQVPVAGLSFCWRLRQLEGRQFGLPPLDVLLGFLLPARKRYRATFGVENGDIAKPVIL